MVNRGLHGPVFFGPARPVQLRPGPACCRSRKIRPSPARPVSSWARPGPLPSLQKKNSFKTTKKHRIKHTLVFLHLILYWVLILLLTNTRILGVINYFMSSPARPVCIRARPGPFKLIYFPARPRPGPQAAGPCRPLMVK